MATIKKACKGTSYPKASSVSKRLGSPSKAKAGSKVKKAQNGLKTKRGNWEYKVDTPGYAAGRKMYTLEGKNVKTGATRKDETFPRYLVKGIINKELSKKAKTTKKNKEGGVTEKAQWGYQGPRKFSLNPFGSKEKREWRKENREGRRAGRACRSGRCGGRSQGFIGYKSGGKIKKKQSWQSK